MFPGSFFFLQRAEGPVCFVMDFSDVVEARFNRGFSGNAVPQRGVFVVMLWRNVWSTWLGDGRFFRSQKYAMFF
jgi:hypothetical protein